MNTLSLENYGVSQMETREMKTTEGGNWWRALILAIAAAHEETCSGSSYRNCSWISGVGEYMGTPMYN